MKTDLNLFVLKVYNTAARITQDKFFVTLSFLSLLFLLISAAASAQTKTITGLVRDDENQALVAASVSVKGTHEGVLTDEHGHFSISVDVSKNDILVFSFMGMKNTEVSITDKSELNVTLYSDPTFFTELVVTGEGTSDQPYTEKKSSRKGLFKKRKGLF
ncbi:MAG TPA: carboxypeptidase-like regulatory domain-containing protein [Cyclobacteriaceae bacterium]|nr:carboxypeptidase-like regulatory domain-containing protein [Cyclobacteriaceae bacterium]HMV09192.1 carboxypeptidase-like regulatory domain-containing protein [Cyclobacteriaceae bacterium]HMV90324.1 carboxypeptidase-like regulatory domain-containing protein [Cyclobacteriaceae bacterium]HMX01439.1 carboxypeptidase-like regulatory domain-containing protein [Cyclobacteriaceae bacterium]HMX50291.1 carboxypeptidase-like regulatory domain-containing protein [Cyclobacteriaceae bacterium]